MIRKFYDKNELVFSIIWIIAYCVFASIGDNLSDALGISKVITLPILLVLSAISLQFRHWYDRIRTIKKPPGGTKE